MKKTILLLFVMTAATLSACKKEREKKSWKDDLSQYIERTWLTLEDNVSYYNDKGQLVHEETTEPNASYKMNDGNLRYIGPDNETINGSYIISNSNGKDIVTVIMNGATEAYEVVSIDDSLMTWRQESATNIKYTENGVEKSAAKKIHTLNLHCTCPPH